MKAIILAAGFGTRMEGFTKNCPKPMLKIGKFPLIYYIIENLKRVGVNEVGINLHYLPEVIRNDLGDGSKLGIQITYIYEEEPTGTAGGVKSLSPFLKGCENFFVVYGDIFTDQDLNPIIQKHLKTNSIGTILLHKRKNSNSMITVDKNGIIENFYERPSEDLKKELNNQNIDFYVNSAIYLLSEKILDLIPSNKKVDFPKDIFPLLIKDRKLSGVPLTGNRVAIDTPDRYQQAQELLKENKVKIKIGV